MNALEAEFARLGKGLAHLDRVTPPDWRNTPIANWGKNGLTNEAARLLEPSWWQRSETPAAAAIQNLFRRYERANDDEEETEAEKKARRERAAGGRGPGKENIEADSAEEVDVDELAPQGNETVSAWLARLGKAVDFNDENRKPLWKGLRAFTQRYPGDSPARNVDAKVVAAFLKNIK